MPKTTTYRNGIEALLGILPSEVEQFNRKRHSRTRPEWKRLARKRQRAARKANR